MKLCEHKQYTAPLLNHFTPCENIATRVAGPFPQSIDPEWHANQMKLCDHHARELEDLGVETKLVDEAGRKRLEILAGFLDTCVPDESFDIRTYTNSPGESPPWFCNIRGDVNPVLGPCGTTACAAGWAVTIPVFRQEGLRLEYDGSMCAIRYQSTGSEDMTAGLCRFFQLDHDTCMDIFFSIGYTPRPVTKDMVVQRIRHYVKTGNCIDGNEGNARI